MVEIKNAEVFNLERAQRAIENSFNVGEINTTEGSIKEKLAKSLGCNMQTHQSHDAWLKGVLVTYDIKGNGVFMPEFQRYHHHEIVMSQSTMHSMEKFMTGDYDPFTKYVDTRIKEIVREKYNEWVSLKELLNKAQSELEKFIKESATKVAGTYEERKVAEQQMANDKTSYLVAIEAAKKEQYEAFERLIHSLPRGFELWATVTTNYLQLKTIVIQRAHHKNQEDWGAFVAFCYSLPKFRELCGFDKPEWDLEALFPLYKE